MNKFAVEQKWLHTTRQNALKTMLAPAIGNESSKENSIRSMLFTIVYSCIIRRPHGRARPPSPSPRPARSPHRGPEQRRDLRRARIVEPLGIVERGGPAVGLRPRRTGRPTR